MYALNGKNDISKNLCPACHIPFVKESLSSPTSEATCWTLTALIAGRKFRALTLASFRSILSLAHYRLVGPWLGRVLPLWGLLSSAAQCILLVLFAFLQHFLESDTNGLGSITIFFPNQQHFILNVVQELG